jgi:hypothetical protein
VAHIIAKLRSRDDCPRMGKRVWIKKCLNCLDADITVPSLTGICVEPIHLTGGAMAALIERASDQDPKKRFSSKVTLRTFG